MTDVPRGRLELRYIRDNETLDVTITSRIDLEHVDNFRTPFVALLAAVGFSEETIRQEVGGP